MIKAVKTSIMLALLLIAQPLTSAYAETIHLEVSGNGNGSESQIETQVQSEVNVEQQNTSEVNNDVNIEANTGENQANGNTAGDTAIQTGNISTETVIENNLNTSTIDSTNCCEQSNLEIEVSSNGANSQNTVNFEYQNEVNAQITQKADISNTVNGKANTGRNEANNNGGNVDISTGSIAGGVKINTSANNSSANIDKAGIGEQHVKISGNGEETVNTISISLLNTKDIQVHNYADIENLVFFDLNTGENKAYGNLGDVIIETGSIDFLVDIGNGPINANGLDIGGCCVTDPGDPDDPYDPYTPPSDPGSGGTYNSSGNSSSSSNSNGQSLGSVLGAAGDILPATGSFWLLLMVLANVLTFLMGLYLRLRSGRSPSARLHTVRA